MTAPSGRYSITAISLHWLIAALILFQIGYAWWWLGAMPDHSPAQTAALHVHMSIGLTILVLSLIRLGVRLATPVPPLPIEMPAWERLVARISHALFYVLIIGIPFTGWALASMRKPPIMFWGLFAWPHLPFMSGFSHALRHQVSHPLQLTHTTILVWGAVVLLVLHVAGALKNQLFGPAVIWRMAPIFPRPKDRGEVVE
jgi:cytochrome b561